MAQENIKLYGNCPVSKRYCAQCHDGFHRNPNYNATLGIFEYTCELDLCVCENGSPPSNCLEPHGSEVCESCDSNYELLQEICIPSNLKEFCYKAAPIDIVYVVDGSGSVGYDAFMLELNFLRTVSGAMDIGPNSTRIALVQYDHHDQLEFNFIDDPSKIVSAFGNINYMGGATRTGKAITFAYDFVVRGYARAGINVKIVVVTDGQSGDDVKIASDAMRDHGIEMLAVGFSHYNLAQLQDIANNPDQEYLFTGGSGDDLKGLIEDVTLTVCKTDEVGTRLPGGFSPLDENVLAMIEDSYVEAPEI